MKKSVEIGYVDDGSTDNSLRILKEIASRNKRVKVVVLRRNYGQRAFISAGIDASTGRL